MFFPGAKRETGNVKQKQASHTLGHIKIGKKRPEIKRFLWAKEAGFATVYRIKREAYVRRMPRLSDRQRLLADIDRIIFYHAMLQL